MRVYVFELLSCVCVYFLSLFLASQRQVLANALSGEKERKEGKNSKAVKSL